jgi:hypothetical protein
VCEVPELTGSCSQVREVLVEGSAPLLVGGRLGDVEPVPVLRVLCNGGAVVADPVRAPIPMVVMESLFPLQISTWVHPAT